MHAWDCVLWPRKSAHTRVLTRYHTPMATVTARADYSWWLDAITQNPALIFSSLLALLQVLNGSVGLSSGSDDCPDQSMPLMGCRLCQNNFPRKLTYTSLRNVFGASNPFYGDDSLITATNLHGDDLHSRRRFKRQNYTFIEQRNVV